MEGVTNGQTYWIAFLFPLYGFIWTVLAFGLYCFPLDQTLFKYCYIFHLAT